MGWVTRRDWDRYVKGRVEHGELLVEVKGKAEKVAIVPDDFPPETLITGTLFKFKAREEVIDPHFLLCYLLSRYGRGFRSRCLTNTLIGFVSKDELYQIPVPIPERRVQARIAALCKSAIAREKQSHVVYAKAQDTLGAALGLDTLDLSSKLAYTARFSAAQTAGRLDPQFFQPKFSVLLRKLETLKCPPLGSLLSEPVSKGVTPEYVEDGEVPLINSQHLGKTLLDVGRADRTTRAFYNANPKAHLRINDVMIYATGAYVGRTNVLLDDIQAFAGMDLIIVRPDPHCADAILDAVKVIDHCYPASSVTFPAGIKVLLRLVALHGTNGDKAKMTAFENAMVNNRWGGPKPKVRTVELPVPVGHRRYWGIVVHSEYATVEALLNRVGAP